jgi:FkbM family methyltransferase
MTKVINRLSETKRQLTWVRFISYFLEKVSLKILDPHIITSYSQFGEDRFIERYFRPGYKGIYVDVGCNHPISFSNTWKLYLKGWSGVSIDANPEVIGSYCKVRPRDIAIARVISCNEKPVDFYFSNHSNLVSGIGEKSNGNWPRTRQNSHVVKVTPVRLFNVLKEFQIPFNFDLLSIDTEGSELDVLESLNLTLYRPKLILVEIHDLDFLKLEESAVYCMLVSNNYRMISYLQPTAIFVLGELGG